MTWSMLDSADLPHIAYYDSGTGNLKYAVKEAGTWDIFIADGEFADVGLYCSLALDPEGWPHISYYDRTNGNLKYVYLDSGGVPHCSISHSAAIDPFSCHPFLNQMPISAMAARRSESSSSAGRLAASQISK